jgi:hypothetical protein
MVASAGETEWDLAGRQFPGNCLPYNIIEFKYHNFKLYNFYNAIQYFVLYFKIYFNNIIKI